MFQSIVLCINNKTLEMDIASELKREGYQIITSNEGSDLIRRVRSRNIDLIIIDDDMKGISTMDICSIVFTEKICPVVLIANQYGLDYLEWIHRGWIYTYLTMPLNRVELYKAVKGSIVNGQRMLQIEKEIHNLREELSQRKSIDKAKGIVMEKRKLNEEDAYEYLRKLSMNKGISIHKLSTAIINKFKSD